MEQKTGECMLLHENTLNSIVFSSSALHSYMHWSLQLPFTIYNRTNDAFWWMGNMKYSELSTIFIIYWKFYEFSPLNKIIFHFVPCAFIMHCDNFIFSRHNQKKKNVLTDFVIKIFHVVCMVNNIIVHDVRTVCGQQRNGSAFLNSAKVKYSVV